MVRFTCRRVLADNEAELQDKLQRHPELLPLEELGLEGPLLIVGRETSLPSGAVDLVGLARNGAILVIEFKTGPQNSDFRHALAQMVDYGSHLWEMDPDNFETTVARRYFATAHCDQTSNRLDSIAAAATAMWPGLTDDELAAFTDGWHAVLASGGFHFVLVAQRFTPTITRTMQYMNQISQPARFWAVELVRFTGRDMKVYEGRTVVRHDRSTTASRAAALTTEQRLLDRFDDDTYRQAVEQLLAFCRGQGLVLEWGSVGVSMRLRLPDVAEPISIGWVYPPGATGWSGLRDLTLGHDEWRARKDIPDTAALDAYVDAIARLPGSQPVTNKSVRGHRLPPDTVTEQYAAITDALAQLIRAIASYA
jgi:hypothetical protein